MQTIAYSWPWDLSSDKGERIDTWLTKQFDYSRNFFHHIIERGWISVNNKKIKKSHKLKDWDQIFIDDLSRYLSPVILDEAPNISIPIILEKEDYLVINKPKWVLSHPNSVWEVSQPSVVWFLYHNYKNLPTIWNFIRAWLLHRLDKDTDGLMIIAKTEKWLSHFKKLFQERSSLLQENISNNHQISSESIIWNSLHKFYRATCYITPKWKEFLSEISSQLPYYIQELVVPKIPHYTPKIWITKILWFEQWNMKWNGIPQGGNWTMKQCNIIIEILTWRTHQIRYHLSNHWLPIVGDYLYSSLPDKWNEVKSRKAGENLEGLKMQLTAYKLEFVDPDWENKILEI